MAKRLINFNMQNLREMFKCFKGPVWVLQSTWGEEKGIGGVNCKWGEKKVLVGGFKNSH